MSIDTSMRAKERWKWPAHGQQDLPAQGESHYVTRISDSSTTIIAYKLILEMFIRLPCLELCATSIFALHEAAGSSSASCIADGETPVALPSVMGLWPKLGVSTRDNQENRSACRA